MTVSTEATRWEDVGDGTLKPFVYTNRIFADTDLKVYVDGVLQGLTTDYTVSGAGDFAGGSVNFVVAVPSSIKTLILRDVANTQSTQFPVGGPLPSVVIANALDRRTMISQQLEETVGRALRYLESDDDLPSGEMPALSTLKGNLLGFNASTGAPYGVSMTSVPVTAAWTTPEAHGAVGDGAMDDQVAFDAAIAAAVGSGQEIVGDPSKTYYIGTSLAAFTGTLRIRDCHFKAPNQVRLLLGAPTWAAANTTLTSVTSTTIDGSTVTQVLLTSTTGLAVGDWVMVGSSTQQWPAVTSGDIWWFEAAQIVALSANTSIDLHRRLLGEETGGVSADLTLFKIPDFRLEATNLRFTADGTVTTAGQSGRLAAIELRGGIGHRIINCHAFSWWERIVQMMSSVKSTVSGMSWDLLPDVTSAGSEAFGYGVQEIAACYGNLITGMNGGRCRHAYTASGYGAAYSAATPWQLGIVARSLITDSISSGHSGAGFDTHKESADVTFTNCLAVDVLNSPTTNAGAPHGFQLRGWRTACVGCGAIGGDHGFKIAMVGGTWGALDDNVLSLSGCFARHTAQSAIRLEGTPTDNVLNVTNFDASDMQYAVMVSSGDPWGGRLNVNGMNAFDIGTFFSLDKGGVGHHYYSDMRVLYRGMASANAVFRIDAIPTGQRTYDNIRIYRLDASNPDGMFDINLASAFSPVVGRIMYDLGTTFPLLAPSSDGGASLTETLLRATSAPTDADGNEVFGYTDASQVALDSGNLLNISGISHAVKIEIFLTDVSIDVQSNIGVQIGPSGGVETSGYTGRFALLAATDTVYRALSGSAWVVSDFVAATETHTGKITLDLIDAATNTWMCNSTLWLSTTADEYVDLKGALKTLAGVLEQFTLQVSGANNFDGAGKMSYRVTRG